MIREINEYIEKVKLENKKARMKQVHLEKTVKECEEILKDHPEMIKCRSKHDEQVKRLKDCMNLLEN